MTLMRLCFFIVLFFLFKIGVTQAEETDQFTLPPMELMDIGPIASQRLYDVLSQIIAKTNSEIQVLLPKAQHSNYAAVQLAKRYKNTYFADALYAKTGPGFPRWLRGSYLFNSLKPALYKEKRPWKTIYWLVFSQSPLFVIGLAPTINMYGYEFGTDKLGHFFMQGHTYYKIYTYLLAHGKSPKQAHDMMILYGQILEQTYLGTLINGVYSNADLSGNYAGWKFYTNLTQPVKIGNHTLPPLLILKGNQWQFASYVNKDLLLKPYLSNNLNEAFNPCRYTFMRNRIRNHIKKRCNEWVNRRGITPVFIEKTLKETKRWHGEEYGHWLPTDTAVTLNACFGGK